MRELMVRSDRELRRLDQAIAALDEKPCADRLRLRHLLAALVAERDAIQSARQSASPALAVSAPP
jgi:hypothetical protein